jgi:hypothetical protein
LPNHIKILKGYRQSDMLPLCLLQNKNTEFCNKKMQNLIA